MAKHIHIHVAPGMRVTGARTGDAGNWDESKHKRADDGKFGSGGGTAPTQGKSGAKLAGDPDIEYNGKKYKAHSGRVMEMTHAQYERIQPGKVYMFDGRKALVTGKRLPTDKNAAGVVAGHPTMTVLWFKKKE